MRRFMIIKPYRLLSERSNQRAYGQGMWHVRKIEIHTGFWWKTWRKEQFGRPRHIYEKITLQLILKKWDGTAQTAFIRLRIEKWQTLANTIVKLLVLQNLGSFLTNSENDSFSKRTLLNAVTILQGSGNGMTFELTNFLHHTYWKIIHYIMGTQPVPIFKPISSKTTVATW
jgi:hypothetical protein